MWVVIIVACNVADIVASMVASMVVSIVASIVASIVVSIWKNCNNHVFTFQGNRIPFINHPEFASLIWEPTTSFPVTTGNEILITINKTFIIINAPRGISSMELYSITGQLIQQQKPAGQISISIPKANLPRGIHIIKINQSSTFKICIN